MATCCHLVLHSSTRDHDRHFCPWRNTLNLTRERDCLSDASDYGGTTPFSSTPRILVWHHPYRNYRSRTFRTPNASELSAQYFVMASPVTASPNVHNQDSSLCMQICVSGKTAPQLRATGTTMSTTVSDERSSHSSWRGGVYDGASVNHLDTCSRLDLIGGDKDLAYSRFRSDRLAILT